MSQNVFWQNRFGPNIYLNPESFWTHIFGNTIFLDWFFFIPKLFFGPKVFLAQNLFSSKFLFWTKIFFRPKVFLPKYSGSKMFLVLLFFSFLTHYIFWPNIFLDQTIIGLKMIFSLKILFGENISFAQKLFFPKAFLALISATNEEIFWISIFNSLSKIYLRMEFDSGIGPTCFCHTRLEPTWFSNILSVHLSV